MTKCRQCSAPFDILPEENDFLQRITPSFGANRFPVPPPGLCPLCRFQRRLAWRSELNLFRRKSSKSGRDMISFFPPPVKLKVYSWDEWWQDDWDGTEFGRDFDFSRPFFEQFSDLIGDVPLIGLSLSSGQENSDYTNCAGYNKNCYLLAAANYNEDCYYGNYLNHCRYCVDNTFAKECELCYECVDCANCYNLRYSRNCYHCSDSFFLDSCRSCRDCFACANLFNKQHCFYNQQLSRDEYERRISAAGLQSRAAVDKFGSEFATWRLTLPHRSLIGDMNENVSGNGINNCRNALCCFDVSNLEDCRYCTWLHNSRDCQDVIAWGFSAELCYQCTEVGENSNHVLWSITTYGSHNIYYGYWTMYCRDCFGCVGLKKKQYCILNKQYSKGDYERLAFRVARHMQETGEWGQFFPLKHSPLPYNTTIAQQHFPLGPRETAALGLSFYEEPQLQASAASPEVPDDIATADDSVCDRVFVCPESGKVFRITRPELAFCKRQGIPLPIFAPYVRHMHRFQRRNPRQLWDRECARCRRRLQTSYPPYRPEIVYCPDCYRDVAY